MSPLPTAESHFACFGVGYCVCKDDDLSGDPGENFTCVMNSEHYWARLTTGHFTSVLGILPGEDTKDKIARGRFLAAICGEDNSRTHLNVDSCGTVYNGYHVETGQLNGDDKS